MRKLLIPAVVFLTFLVFITSVAAVVVDEEVYAIRFWGSAKGECEVYEEQSGQTYPAEGRVRIRGSAIGIEVEGSEFAYDSTSIRKMHGSMKMEFDHKEVFTIRLWSTGEIEARAEFIEGGFEVDYLIYDGYYQEPGWPREYYEGTAYICFWRSSVQLWLELEGDDDWICLTWYDLARHGWHARPTK